MTACPRIYTPKQASEMIPKFMDLFPKLRYLRDQIIKVRNQCDVEEITSHGLEGRLAKEARERMNDHRARIDVLEVGMEKNLKVFDGLDCELKGLDPGLVDFYTRKDGQLAYLCWSENEPLVQFWHPLSGGYAGRKPIT